MAKVISKNVASNGNMPRVSGVDEFPAPLADTITVELDSGRVVEMVIAELSMLHEAGDIPDDLTPVVVRLLFAPRQRDEQAQERERNYREELRLAKWLVGKVLRKPAIPMERLYHTEIWDIYNLANSPAEALRRFRRQQASHVAVVPDVQDVQPVAEPADGDNE